MSTSANNVYSSEVSVQLPPINYMFVRAPLWARLMQTISVLGFIFFLITSLVEQQLAGIGFLLTFSVIYMIVSHYGRRERDINQIVSDLQFEEEWKETESYRQVVNFLTLLGFDNDISNKFAVELALPAIVGLEKVLDTELNSTDIVTGDKVKVVVRLRPTMKNYRMLHIEAFLVYPATVHEKE